MTINNLKVGARGWRHERWLTSYYPDDLPEDWQLTYYANDFEVVIVPQAYWTPSKGYPVGDWQEAVGENFRFYLEYPPLDSDEEIKCFQNQCIELGDLLGGIVVAEGFNVDKVVLSCPVIDISSVGTSALCVGVMDKDFEDLRKARVWLETFDKNSQSEQKVVIVSNGTEDDISMESLLKIQTLSEMMGL